MEFGNSLDEIVKTDDEAETRPVTFRHGKRKWKEERRAFLNAHKLARRVPRQRRSQLLPARRLCFADAEIGKFG